MFLRLVSIPFAALLLLLFLPARAQEKGNGKATLVFQTGHAAPVGALAFSRDGRVVATAQRSFTVMMPVANATQEIKLWDAQTGRELLTLYGHELAVTALAFNPAEDVLASGGLDGRIILWDYRRGAKRHTIEKANAEGVVSLAFSPDGKLLASGGDDSAEGDVAEIKLWDASAGAFRRTLTEKSKTVNSLAFTPDGKRLVSRSDASGDFDSSLLEEVKVWNLSTGKAALALSAESPTLSPDGRWAVVQVDDETNNAPSKVQIRNLLTGETKSPIDSGEKYFIAFAFSPDGKYLAGQALSNTLDPRATLSTFLWDTSTGQPVELQEDRCGNRASKLYRFSPMGAFMVFSPDGRTLATGGGTDAALLSLDGQRPPLVLAGHTTEVAHVAFSPDGATLASVGNGIRVWDLAAGSQARSLPGVTSAVLTVALSPDGNFLASGNTGLTTLNGKKRERPKEDEADEDEGSLLPPTFRGETDSQQVIQLWNLKTGALLGSVDGPGLMSHIAFSGDGKLLAGAGSLARGLIVIWDATNGRELRMLPGHDGYISTMAFHPKRQILASGGSNKGAWAVKLWDAEKGTKLRTLAKYKLPVTALAFSPDGRRLAVAVGNQIELWDAEAGVKLDTRFETGGLALLSLAFSADGARLSGSGSGPEVKLWDARTGALSRSFDSRSDVVPSVALSPDGKLIAGAGGDRTIKLWDATGRELARLVAVDQADWLAVAGGQFDGSPGAWRHIGWRFSARFDDVVPVEAFFNESFRPGLLRRALAGETIPPANIEQRDRRLPEVSLALSEPRAMQACEVASRQVKVRVEVEQAQAGEGQPAGGVRDVRLFRNGSLVKVWRGDVLDLKDDEGCRVGERGRVSCEASVPVTFGENRFTAYAFNRDDVKSEDAALNVRGAAQLERFGTAYIIAIGIDEYANRDFNLNFAVADATDFANELKLRQSRLGKYADVRTVSLTNAQATRANILLALARLAGTEAGELPAGAPADLRKLQPAEPEDAVFIFFSGHGLAADTRMDAGQFFLVPHDIAYAGARESLGGEDLARVMGQAVSDRALERGLEGVDAGLLMLVIDACHSGRAFDASDERQGPMNSKGLAQLAYEKGIYILAASEGYEAAREDVRYGHGWLTQALIEDGLKQRRADRPPGDGLIELREWFDFAVEQVPLMQAGWMQTCKDVGRECSVLGGQTQTPGARGLQHPRVFYRRDAEAQPILIARTESGGGV